MNAVTGFVHGHTHRDRECVYAVRGCAGLKGQEDGIAQPCNFGLGIWHPGCVEDIDVEHGDE
jgi:hypothetical protein